MMTREIIACCGLNCASCRAYVATREGDVASLAETARLWSNEGEGAYKAEDIPCEGCHSERLHAFCARCPVRACAKDKGLENCGKCSGYPCGKLESLWGSWTEASPVEARANLDAVKARTPPS